MDTRAEPTPFDQRLFVIFIATFATMTAFEFAGQFLYPYPPDWRSNLVTSFFTSGIAVIIAYFTLSPYYEKNVQLLSEMERRHSVEMELREREERLRRTFDQSPVGAAIISPDLRFIQVNTALCTITGYAPDEILSLPLSSIVAPDENAGIITGMEDLKSGAIELDQHDMQLVRKDGARIWVRRWSPSSVMQRLFLSISFRCLWISMTVRWRRMPSRGSTKNSRCSRRSRDTTSRTS